MLNRYVVRSASNNRQEPCKNSKLQATYKKRKQTASNKQQTANNKRHTSANNKQAYKQKQIGR